MSRPQRPRKHHPPASGNASPGKHVSFEEQQADSDIEMADATPEDQFTDTIGPEPPVEAITSDDDDSSGVDKDEQICEDMVTLIEEINQFACSFKAIRNKQRFFHDLLIEENKELIRYIGCIAMGGNFHGWETLVTDATCRQALVVGIIGRALREHVFSELYFGSSKQLQDKLNKLEEDQMDQDGFIRTQTRAKAIKASYSPGGSMHKTGTFEAAVTKVTARLSTMLSAFLDVKGNADDLVQKLYSIVFHAGELSCKMRMASDVVYYWPPTFKDEEFEPSRMEAHNLSWMIAHSPYERKKNEHGRERAVLKPGQEGKGEAIVRVVCFPGLVAYRQGGGELARKELAAEKGGPPVPHDVRMQRRHRDDAELNEHSGIRSKVICKSLVLLQWGQQRLLTKEAGTSAHIDAVRDGKMDRYEDDYKGFVELYDLAESAW